MESAPDHPLAERREKKKRPPAASSALCPKFGSERAGPMQCSASAEAISFSFRHGDPGRSIHRTHHFGQLCISPVGYLVKDQVGEGAVTGVRGDQPAQHGPEDAP